MGNQMRPSAAVTPPSPLVRGAVPRPSSAGCARSCRSQIANAPPAPTVTSTGAVGDQAAAGFDSPVAIVPRRMRCAGSQSSTVPSARASYDALPSGLSVAGNEYRASVVPEATAVPVVGSQEPVAPNTPLNCTPSTRLRPGSNVVCHGPGGAFITVAKGAGSFAPTRQRVTVWPEYTAIRPSFRKPSPPPLTSMGIGSPISARVATLNTRTVLVAASVSTASEPSRLNSTPN